MGDETTMNKKMNKKGTLVLRDLMFMLVIFSGILALSSIFVVNMSNEYSNTDMNTEYYASDSIGSLGDEGLVNVSASIETMKDETSGSVGSWELVTGAVKGIGTVLSTVLKSPIYVGKALTTMMVALRIPFAISSVIGNIIIFLIYLVIIFVIMSAFLRGGKV